MSNNAASTSPTLAAMSVRCRRQDADISRGPIPKIMVTSGSGDQSRASKERAQRRATVSQQRKTGALEADLEQIAWDDFKETLSFCARTVSSVASVVFSGLGSTFGSCFGCVDDDYLEHDFPMLPPAPTILFECPSQPEDPTVAESDTEESAIVINKGTAKESAEQATAEAHKAGEWEEVETATEVETDEKENQEDKEEQNKAVTTGKEEDKDIQRRKPFRADEDEDWEMIC